MLTSAYEGWGITLTSTTERIGTHSIQHIRIARDIIDDGKNA